MAFRAMVEESSRVSPRGGAQAPGRVTFVQRTAQDPGP